MSRSRIQSSYYLLPRVLELLRKQRESSHLTMVEIIARGVDLLGEQGIDLKEIPPDPYGSNKKPKVFNMPVEVHDRIGDLAKGVSRSHVVAVAIRVFAGELASESDASPPRKLRDASNEELLAEVERRGLLLGGSLKSTDAHHATVLEDAPIRSAASLDNQRSNRS